MIDFLPQTTAQIPGSTNKYEYKVLKRGVFTDTLTGSATTWGASGSVSIGSYDASIVMPRVDLALDVSASQGAPDSAYPHYRLAPFAYHDSAGTLQLSVNYWIGIAAKPSSITINYDIYSRSGSFPNLILYYLVTSLEIGPNFTNSNPDATTGIVVPFR